MQRMSNEQFAAEDISFRAACSAADIPATKRQASKFRMQKGKAYKFSFLRKEAKKQEDMRTSS